MLFSFRTRHVCANTPVKDRCFEIWRDCLSAARHPAVTDTWNLRIRIHAVVSDKGVRLLGYRRVDVGDAFGADDKPEIISTMDHQQNGG